ncbi:hypothetical protein C2G38_2251279 [Gigaspora rosea]|uniref:Methyltransferase type 11 domain-containing protein n=1 Tax=Gigaspora rosea TaxID=44941 RepID=A0A397UR43_9GLOM|nr:hypothetical protein C2G38_2251279 [Gigaspora rosea]
MTSFQNRIVNIIITVLIMSKPNNSIFPVTSESSSIPRKKVLLKYNGYDDNDFASFLQLSTHKILNGRKYFNENETKCILPSDEKEVNREAMSNAIRKHLFKKNFFSPIEEKLIIGAKVLDIGISISTFIGIDMDSTKFPSHDQHPPNVGFLACNITHGIPFPSETFDFVHMSDPWVKNYGKVGKLVIETFMEMCKTKGINVNIHAMIPKLIGSMNELRDLEYVNAEYPLGDWGGCLGKFTLANIRKACEGIVNAQKYFGLSAKEYDDLLTNYVKELNENRATGFYHRYFARKVHTS